MGIGIMSNAVWGLGFSIVDTRRRKLIKRLMATPMSRVQYLRLVPHLAADAVSRRGGASRSRSAPSRSACRSADRGSTITIVCLLGSLTFSALGILVGSRARTIEAVSGLMNLVIMPMWIVSGVFFSAQRFPDFVQPIIKALPLTRCIDCDARAFSLQGVSITQRLARAGDADVLAGGGFRRRPQDVPLEARRGCGELCLCARRR